jgi:hypothetical protein
MKKNNPFFLLSFSHRPFLLIIAGFFLLLTGGCANFSILPSHLHNPDREKLAKEVRDEMKEYRTNAPGMYAAMLTNLETFKKEEDWLLSELAANSDTAFITALPTMKGLKLANDLEKIKNEILVLQTRIHGDNQIDAEVSDEKEKKLFKDVITKAKDDVKDAQVVVGKAKTEEEKSVAKKALENAEKKQADVEKNIKDLKDAKVKLVKAKTNLKNANKPSEKVEAQKVVAQQKTVVKLAKSKIKAENKVAMAQKEVKDVKENLTKWNGQVALFQNLIGQFPDLKKKLTEDEVKLDDLFETFKLLAATEIKYKDADGNDKAEKISKLIKIFEADKKVNSDALFSIASAPGLSVELAIMGLELAQIQQKREAAELNYLRMRAVLMEDTLLSSHLALNLVEKSIIRKMNEDQNWISFVAVKKSHAPDVWNIPNKSHSVWGMPIDESAKLKKDQEIRNRAKKYQDVVDSVHDGLISLRFHSVARSIVRRQNSVYELELKRLKHQQSILQSKLGDEAWQALVGTGLESLVSFHQGGFKEEHLNTLIRLGQAGAVIALAE